MLAMKNVSQELAILTFLHCNKKLLFTFFVESPAERRIVLLVLKKLSNKTIENALKKNALLRSKHASSI